MLLINGASPSIYPWKHSVMPRDPLVTDLSMSLLSFWGVPHPNSDSCPIHD